MIKASTLTKTSLTIQEIEKRIKEVQESKNELGVFKIFYPHWVYVADEIKLELMNSGFKVYQGSWDGIINNALIIEW